MKLNRTNLILVGLLIVQIALAVLLSLTSVRTVESSRGPLLGAFAPDDVSQVVITDGTDATHKPITLLKSGSGWVLPDFDNYPVDFNKALTLANALHNMDTRRLIAQNAASQARLKVSPDAFDRKIEAKIGDRTVTLYLGTANEANAAYARVADQNAVYLSSGLSVTDVGGLPVSWVNSAYVTISTNDIASLKVENANGTFTFNRVNGAWVLPDVKPGEQFSQDAVNTLVNQLGTVALTAPIGAKADDKLGLSKPQATITILTRTAGPTPTPQPPTPTPAVGLGVQPPPQPELPTSTPRFIEKTYVLQVGAKLDNGDYAFKSADSTFYVRVGAAFASPFIDLNRQKVAPVPPTPTPFGPLAPVSPTPAVTVAPPLAPTLAATQPATQAVTAIATQAVTAAPTTGATVQPTAATAAATSAP
jgi:hypothetical protein